MKKIFSTEGLLVMILVLVAYWVFFGGDKKKSLSKFPDETPIGISDRLNPEAIEELGVNLTEHLNPELVPALVAEAMKEASNVAEDQFVSAFVANVSNKIQDISTIDLNNDGVTDPILVVPAETSEEGGFLRLSIRVPDPAEVETLPATSDQDAWRDIAENKAIEVMTASAVQDKDEQMTMQATPNPQMYPAQGGYPPPYYQHHTSFTSILLTSMLVHSLFTPRYYGGFYGGGFRGGAYGGGYAPRQVTTVQNARAGSATNLAKASPSQTPATSRTGQSVSGGNFKQTSTKSLSAIKTNQYKARVAGGRVGSGGFGKGASAPSSVQRGAAPTQRQSFGSQRRGFGSGGFGGGGFGRKGFGGFRRR